MAVCGLAGALVCGARPSLAGDEEKRKELLEDLEDEVEELVDTLEDLPGASSDRPVDDARSIAGKIKSLAYELERVAGDDRDAQRTGDVYQDEMDELVGVLGPLRALKQGQQHAQPEAAMCAEKDAELVRAAREFESKNDRRGVAELPKLASAAQDAAKRALDEVHRDDDRLEDQADDVEDFSADGGLRAVDSTLASVAQQIYRAAHESEAKADKACELLAKGAEHPVVREVVEKLAKQRETGASRLAAAIDAGKRRWESMQSAYVEMEKQLWAHINESKKLRKFDADDMKQLITFYCGQDHERDGDAADDLSARMAATIVANVQGRVNEYTKSADAVDAKLKEVYGSLRDFQAELEKDAAEIDKLPGIDADELRPLRDVIALVAALRDKDREKFFGVAKGDRDSYMNVVAEDLKGANNPKIEASKRHGQRQHRDLQSSFGCDRKEHPAGGGYADCVRFKDCTIFEFKPDSWSESEARRDGEGYLSDVNREFSKSSSEGKPWAHCWHEDGPTDGDGFVVQGYRYPRCQ